ncbi:transglutaminase domain-containing protein [uncultured Psychroserpens sp.]|uniref:transglutaminase domain-containing protein n=1 Tax=uncultured Psychroserpens sp. TaxID=255436 RepID=UPI002620801E|nr:transglutaminase domain-containing protein [uncultured Psychroserpens sp.]
MPKIITYLIVVIFACQSNAQISDFGAINFKKADSIALACKTDDASNLPYLSHKLTSNLTTDVEQFRAIYMWVCGNIENDYSLYLKNSRKRQKFQNDSAKLNDWNTRFNKVLFRKLLKHEKTICTGYAYLVKELSRLANINCEIVHGFGRTSTINIDRLNNPNHSWNAVQLNDKWYLCDPTWASGIPNPKTFQFKFQYNDGFFLADPQLFAVNHHPIDEKWFLLEEHQRPTFNEFIEAPVIYGKAYKNLSTHSAPKKMHNIITRNEKVIFKYQLLKPISTDQVSLKIDNGFRDRKTKPTSTVIKGKSLTLEYRFEETGFYDVHLLIGDDLISTYTFKVKG